MAGWVCTFIKVRFKTENCLAPLHNHHAHVMNFHLLYGDIWTEKLILGWAQTMVDSCPNSFNMRTEYYYIIHLFKLISLLNTSDLRLKDVNKLITSVIAYGF